MCQFSCHHHLYKNLPHKLFSPCAALCNIPLQIWIPCSARHSREGVLGSRWWDPAWTNACLLAPPFHWGHRFHSILLWILATVTACPWVSKGFRLGRWCSDRQKHDFWLRRDAVKVFCCELAPHLHRRLQLPLCFQGGGVCVGYCLFVEPCNRTPANLGRTVAWRQSWRL